MTLLAQVDSGETGQKGRPEVLLSASTTEIRSTAGGGPPEGSRAAFQANPFALSALQHPHSWLRRVTQQHCHSSDPQASCLPTKQTNMTPGLCLFPD